MQKRAPKREPASAPSPLESPSPPDPSNRTANSGVEKLDPPRLSRPAPALRDPSPPRELVKTRIRETYRRYCAAVAEGDEAALELLRPTLRFERDLVLDCAQEELLLASDPAQAGIIERTMADLRD
ncbi:MAG TPA: hypothetical protein VMU54_03155 [Planctomycetota bacterium]|nr:hypothetical protein [Planctomycetota bacterium]